MSIHSRLLQPTGQPTLTLEVPQCRGKIQTYDLGTKPLEIVQETIQGVACLDFFDLTEHQPNKIEVGVHLIVNPQIPYVFVLAPDNPMEIPGIKQALGNELAQQFNNRWNTATPQEWWDWLAENQTAWEDITADCEQYHNAEQDDRSEYAPWK